jgi:hypothetical protein
MSQRSASPEDSVIWFSDNPGDFASGFVVHGTAHAPFSVTAEHAAEQATVSGSLQIDGHAADVVSTGSRSGNPEIDLAILRVGARLAPASMIMICNWSTDSPTDSGGRSHQCLPRDRILRDAVAVVPPNESGQRR